MQLLTPSDTLQAIAHCVKSTRLKSNITIAELATRSAVGTATLSRIENGGCAQPTSWFGSLRRWGYLIACLTRYRRTMGTA